MEHYTYKTGLFVEVFQMYVSVKDLASLATIGLFLTAFFTWCQIFSIAG